jgi:hypothetical protein
VEQLERLILEGRFCEIRMLFYVGKDVLRWVDQCVEIVEREPALKQSSIEPQSFVSMLIDDPPNGIREKLSQWGVQDYRSIFARAVGMNSVFSVAPDQSTLAAEFISNYHIYADQLYSCWRSAREFNRIRSQDFPFDLYASGEYTRMLEQEWTAEG